jgi:hypothetical protein
MGHDIIEMESLSNKNIIRSRPKSRSSSNEDEPLTTSVPNINEDQDEQIRFDKDEMDILY